MVANKKKEKRFDVGGVSRLRRKLIVILKERNALGVRVLDYGEHFCSPALSTPFSRRARGLAQFDDDGGSIVATRFADSFANEPFGGWQIL